MRSVVHPVATEVMGRADFAVVPYRDRYGALAERLNLNFDSILFTLEHIPLCLDGTLHAEQRADVARLIGERRAVVAAALPDIVSSSFSILALPGDHDLMAGCILPCVDSLINAMLGFDLQLEKDSLVSRIFSQSMGVAKRRRLERELGRIIKTIELVYPKDPPLRIGSRLALAVLGRDALIGTLALSLHNLLIQAAGGRLGDMQQRLTPTHTGVPYIDRQARCPAHVNGAAVAQGEVLRCMLQSLENVDETARMRFFGAGAHVCLGRAVTFDLFEHIAAYLATLPSRVAVTEMTLRDDDVFAYPETFYAKVTS